MTDFWNTDWTAASPMFTPLYPCARHLPETGWPNTEILNEIANERDVRIVNAQGERVRFVPQTEKARTFEQGFEQRTFLSAEVMVRPLTWHDMFNALVWMTFPTAKAVINADRHV